MITTAEGFELVSLEYKACILTSWSLTPKTLAKLYLDAQNLSLIHDTLIEF